MRFQMVSNSNTIQMIESWYRQPISKKLQKYTNTNILLTVHNSGGGNWHTKWHRPMRFRGKLPGMSWTSVVALPAALIQLEAHFPTLCQLRMFKLQKKGMTLGSSKSMIFWEYCAGRRDSYYGRVSKSDCFAPPILLRHMLVLWNSVSSFHSNMFTNHFQDHNIIKWCQVFIRFKPSPWGHLFVEFCWSMIFLPLLQLGTHTVGFTKDAHRAVRPFTALVRNHCNSWGCAGDGSHLADQNSHLKPVELSRIAYKNYVSGWELCSHFPECECWIMT